jgi:hypothetical protein
MCRWDTDPIAKLKVSLWDVSEMTDGAFPSFISSLGVEAWQSPLHEVGVVELRLYW